MIKDLCLFQINIIWNSPYSPLFSSIEEFFGCIKNRMLGKDI